MSVGKNVAVPGLESRGLDLPLMGGSANAPSPKNESMISGRKWTLNLTCAAAASTLTVLKVLNYEEWNDNSTVCTLTSAGIGFLAEPVIEAGTGIFRICKIAAANLVRNVRWLHKNYSASIFFGLTQAYDNTDKDSPQREALQAALLAYGGACVAIKVAEVLGDDPPAPQKTTFAQDGETRELFSPRTEKAMALAELGVGGILLGVSTSFPGATTTCQCLGAFFISMPFGSVGVRKFSIIKEAQEILLREARRTNQDEPITWRLWGFRGAASVSSVGWPLALSLLIVPSHPAGWAGMGLIAGGVADSTRRYYALGPIEDPRIFADDLVKGSVALVGIPAFAIACMATEPAINNKAEMYPPLIAFGFVAPAGYALTRFIRPNAYYTKYNTLWWYLPHLVIRTAMQTGSNALEGYTDWEQKTTTVISYLSWGATLGNIHGNDHRDFPPFILAQWMNTFFWAQKGGS